MRARVSKPSAGSRLRSSKVAQDNRPDVTASKTPERPQSDRDPVQDTTPLKNIKRPLCSVLTNDCSQTETQRQPPRRGARLQGRQPPGIAGCIRPLRASVRRQIEAGAGTSTSERPGGTRRITQLEAEVGQTKATETEQRPTYLKRPSMIPPEVRVEEQQRASPTSLLQKRQIHSDGDNGHQLKRAPLTHKNLAEFSKMTKKNSEGTASESAPPQSTTKSSSTNTISTTMPGFAIQAYKNGILDPLGSKRPTNFKDIRTRYAQSRGTASPTESIYEDYVDTIGYAPNKATMVVEVDRQLLKSYPREDYNRAFNQAFTAFPKDAGFNNGLPAPQPGFIEGPEMPAYCPFPIDEYIKGAVIYEDKPYLITLPHIDGEWKGGGQNMGKARLQSAYNGAALVYARNKALSYLDKSDPPGHAEGTTFTTDGTTLNLFAHYTAVSVDGRLEYHQYPVRSINLTDSRQALRDGRRGLRNEQDYARKQSYALRDQLKEHWQKHRDALRPVAEGALQPDANGTSGETSTDEAGDVAVEQPCQPMPAAASSSVSPKSPPPVDDHVSRSGGQKGEASSSRRSSHDPSRRRTKAREYWRWDAKSGNYYHRHSDGKVTWLEDSDDGD